jgi:hypothetical protein
LPQRSRRCDYLRQDSGPERPKPTSIKSTTMSQSLKKNCPAPPQKFLVLPPQKQVRAPIGHRLSNQKRQSTCHCRNIQQIFKRSNHFTSCLWSGYYTNLSIHKPILPKTFSTNYSPSLNISAWTRSELSVVVIHVWVKRAWFYVFPGSFFIFRFLLSRRSGINDYYSVLSF